MAQQNKPPQPMQPSSVAPLSASGAVAHQSAEIRSAQSEQPAAVVQHKSKTASAAPGVVRPQFVPEPDLVARMVAFIGQERPELDAATLAAVEQRLRQEFGGDTVYVAKQTTRDRGDLVAQVRRMFNGRNATEIARRLKIGRSTVYRMVKTAGER
jgi:hypothetical protein